MDSFFRLHPDDGAKVDALLALMRRLEGRLIAMANRETTHMRDISTLIAVIASETKLEVAAALALNASKQQLDDATAKIAQLQAQVDTDTVDPVQVQTLLDSIATAHAQLAAAVPANTNASGPAVVDQPVVPASAAAPAPAVAVGTTALRTDAPGTVSAPTEGQAASPLVNTPAVPAAADTVPVAAVVPAADARVP